MYSVYIHINKINNKVYIGITSQKPTKRWGNGKNYKKGTLFRNAIDKYGWNNFEHKILYENLEQEIACEIEQQLISEYRSTDKRFGYNNSIGGEIGTLGSHHKLSEETKQKMSIAKKGKKHWWHNKHYGVRHNNHKYKPIICIETNIEYKGLNEASRLTGISKTCISLNANNSKRQSYAGVLPDGTKLHWQFKSTNI